MAAFSKFNCFAQDVGNGLHNLGSDSLYILLTNTAPVAGNAVKTDITELTAGNGYSAGGAVCTSQSYAQTSGVATLKLTAPTFTASGAVGPFRYVVLYNSTSAGKNLIGYYDYGSAVTMASGDTFTPTADPTNGVITLT